MTPSVRRRGHLTATHSVRRGSVGGRSVFVHGAQVAIPVVGRVGHAATATVAGIGRGVAAVHAAQEEAKGGHVRQAQHKYVARRPGEPCIHSKENSMYTDH